MPDLDIAQGPLGKVGSYDVALKDGKLQFSVSIGPKEILDALAAKIGGAVPAEIAKFIEDTFGLA